MADIMEAAVKPIRTRQAAQHLAVKAATPKQPGLLQRLALGWMRWRRVRRDEALLLSQPDYMLHDIGIGRSEIEMAIRGSGRRR